MSDSKKDKKCARHTFIVTSSVKTGGVETARKVRCSHCLIVVDLEQLESAEWQEAHDVNVA